MQVKLQLLLALMLLKANVLLAQTGRSVPAAQFHYESAIYFKSLDNAAHLRLFSADGKEQEGRSIEIGAKGVLELDVSQLSRGVYFLEIKTSEAHFLGKFIKL